MSRSDSPINHPCPHCFAPSGDECFEVEPEFHLARRAARMKALAAKSALPQRPYFATEYAAPSRHRRTFIDRGVSHPEDEIHTVGDVSWSEPRLPFDEPIMNARVVWERAVKLTVDSIFEQQGVR